MPHCRQRASWDCGLACALMVARGAKKEVREDDLEKICKEEGVDRSVWTIDICYVLKR